MGKKHYDIYYRTTDKMRLTAPLFADLIEKGGGKIDVQLMNSAGHIKPMRPFRSMSDLEKYAKATGRKLIEY